MPRENGGIPPGLGRMAGMPRLAGRPHIYIKARCANPTNPAKSASHRPMVTAPPGHKPAPGKTSPPRPKTGGKQPSGKLALRPSCGRGGPGQSPPETPPRRPRPPGPPRRWAQTAGPGAGRTSGHRGHRPAASPRGGASGRGAVSATLCLPAIWMRVLAGTARKPAASCWCWISFPIPTMSAPSCAPRPLLASRPWWCRTAMPRRNRAP